MVKGMVIAVSGLPLRSTTNTPSAPPSVAEALVAVMVTLGVSLSVIDIPALAEPMRYALLGSIVSVTFSSGSVTLSSTGVIAMAKDSCPTGIVTVLVAVDELAIVAGVVV